MVETLTTTFRVTPTRDCLISAFIAGVHLLLMGSPAAKDRADIRLHTHCLSISSQLYSWIEAMMLTCKVDDAISTLDSLSPLVGPEDLHARVR
jgi:hypothetical protein